MIKDRGNKKWVSLMLTEHRRALGKLKSESKKQKKPEVFSDYRTEMDYKLQVALKKGKTVKIAYFQEGEHKIMSGKIKECFPHRKELTLEKNEGQLCSLQWKDILRLQIL
ncbi:MAG: YolD-like family protein [Halanaerobiaceae bacterium]